MSGYAHPEVLVSTRWVREHLGRPGIKLVEVDVDTNAYDAGHIPGAVGFNWQTQLQDTLRRDIPSKEAFEKLLGGHGIGNDDTVILYGDNHNWFAAYAFWLLKIYGHRDVRLMDGGRAKWLNEDDTELTVEKPSISAVTYRASGPDFTIRTRIVDVIGSLEAGSADFVDVRSPDEFTGRVLSPPGLSETAQRGGHIPGAKSVPWATAVNPDGTFRSLDELRKIYLETAGVSAARPTVAYCRIGERSSHSWFVLKYLLGLPDVRNYDGSWTEYGSMVGLPIEREQAETAVV